VLDHIPDTREASRRFGRGSCYREPESWNAGDIEAIRPRRDGRKNDSELRDGLREDSMEVCHVGARAGEGIDGGRWIVPSLTRSRHSKKVVSLFPKRYGSQKSLLRT
jgi:hypothetical protein